MMQLDGHGLYLLIGAIIIYGIFVYVAFINQFDARKRDDFNKGQNKIK